VNGLGWTGVVLLGGTGAIARFLVDTAISQRFGRNFPAGTLAINLSGAFVLGLLTGARASGSLLVLAGTTTIGSYTTFSTWMFETHRLFEDAERRDAALNIIVSLCSGLLAAAAGRAIGTQL
jgi:CrcB protein